MVGSVQRKDCIIRRTTYANRRTQRANLLDNPVLTDCQLQIQWLYSANYQSITNHWEPHARVGDPRFSAHFGLSRSRPEPHSPVIRNGFVMKKLNLEPAIPKLVSAL
jgi:hypothetical protein